MIQRTVIFVNVRFHLQSLIPVVQGHLGRWRSCWGIYLSCQAGTCYRWPPSFRSLCSVMWREDRESSILCAWSTCWACLSEGRIWFQWSLSPWCFSTYSPPPGALYSETKNWSVKQDAYLKTKGVRHHVSIGWNMSKSSGGQGQR